LDFNLTSIAGKPIAKERPAEDIADARHRSMIEAIAPYAKKTQQQNLTPVYVDYKTRNTKLILVLCPEWAPMFPPFNLARLSGVCKSAGYETTIMDLNIRAYNKYKTEWEPNRTLPFSLWDPSANWHWIGDTYMTNIHPTLEPILSEAVDEIVSLNPQAVGFSVYYISEEPTKWMCRELKKRLPNVKILVGGSNVQQAWFHIQPYYDYVVSGEGEGVLLNILEEIENGVVHDKTQYVTQPEDQRININGLPMPDYESIDFSLYDIPNGVNSEISRGCTAKCTFCEETHFWKYRQRQAVDLITEIEWLYYNKGTDIVWFIDSLVNGNLNELRAFCKGIYAKGLKINWTGYARCDGRMDLNYFKDLKAGGCIMLNYGCESGSQKVLDDMAKGVTIQEMEDNFRDGKEVGVFAATNWIVGFPTEDLQDFADTMSFLWRNRNMNINNIGAGTGFGMGPETIVGQNPHKFNVSYQKFQNHWITEDFSKAGTHVMTRVKTFHMFIDFMVERTEKPFGYPIRHSLRKDHYYIRLHNENTIKEVEYEKFDYNIIKIDINPFANSLVNEMWPFFRMMWKTHGGYDAEVKFNPEIDLKEFGDQFGPGMYNAMFKFSINDTGEWNADFDFKFNQHVKDPCDTRDPVEGRVGPFYAQDYSRLQSNTAKRARRLAKPEWSLDTGRSDIDFMDLLSEEAYLNKHMDFSFEHHYIGTGNWGTENFDIAVPNQTTMNSIPEKEAMFSINIDGLRRKDTQNI
jgi:radical SAM superfamily enzyme YgiQ (UPF0313 family)